MTRMRYLVVAAVTAVCGLAAVGTAQADEPAGGPTVSGTATCLGDGTVQFDSHLVDVALDADTSLVSPQGTFLFEGEDASIKIYAEEIDAFWTSDDVPAAAPTITVTLVQEDSPSSAPYTFANPCAATQPPAGTGPVLTVNGTSCPGGVTTLDLHVSKPVNGDEFYALTSPQGTFVYQDSGGDTSLRITAPEADIVWESSDVARTTPTIAVTLTPRGTTPSSNTLSVVNPCASGTAPVLDPRLTVATPNCADGLVQSFSTAGSGFAPTLNTKIDFYQSIGGVEYGQDEFVTAPAASDGTVTGTTAPVLDGQLQSRIRGTVTVFLDQNLRFGGPAPRAEQVVAFDCSTTTAPPPVTESPVPETPAAHPAAPSAAVPPVTVTATQPARATPVALATTGSPVRQLAPAGLLAVLVGAGLLLATRRQSRR